jgi:hypothetical protein
MPYSDVSFAVTCKFNLTYLADFKDLNSNASRAFISNYKDLVKDLIFLIVITKLFFYFQFFLQYQKKHSECRYH